MNTNPDVIHANSFCAGAFSVLAALVTRKKLLLHARDLANLGFLSKFCSWFSEGVIAVSHAVRNALIKKGINPNKVKVVYNGVDDTFCNHSNEGEDVFSTLGHSKKYSFVFAHVGQFVPWKNHIAFLKAASYVAPVLPDVRFVLVGDDIFGRNSAYKSYLLSYAKDSIIAEKTSFLGWQENMEEVWPKINCLVHTTDQEPFGRVIIEAMAHKIPVIAVDSCGPSEIIQNGKTGILVQPNDIDELGDAMLKIAQDAQFANELATAGYEHVISNFTADKTAVHMQEIYREVLAI